VAAEEKKLEEMMEADMSSWNYRIFKRNYPEAITPTLYELHEVYYNKAHKIVAWTQDPEGGPAESVEELLDEMRMKARDAWQSRNDVLDYEMKPEGEWDSVGEGEDEGRNV